MLGRAHRMRDGRDFTSTVRRGRKAAQRLVVVHLVPGTEADPGPETSVGLVVSRAVGAAVTRNRVKRRLRHLLRERIGALPQGSRMVVRALPPAGSASSAQLSGDLDAALRRLAVHRVGSP